MSKTFKNRDNVSDQVDPNDSSNMGLNFYLVSTAMIAALATFNLGINSAVPNIPESTIRQCVDRGETFMGLPTCMPASDGVWGTVIAMFALGGGLGALSCGSVLQILGRRNTILINNLFFIVGGVLIATAAEYAQFGVGRFIIGVASGAATVSVSTYIGEVSPVKGRGAMGTILQLMVVVGILVGQLLSLPLNTSQLWRILFGLTVIPSALQVVLLWFCVESPRYLVSKNKIEGARSSLAKLRSGYSIENELAKIIDGQRANEGDADKSTSILQAMKELFTDKVQFKYLLMAFTLHALQQLSGINGVIFFSTSMIEKSLGDKVVATWSTIGVGFLNLLVTIGSVFAIDRLGRKLLLLIALFGTSVMSLAVVFGSVYQSLGLSVGGVVLFVGFFAIGLGSVPWLIMPEIFPTRTLAAASALCMGLNWMCNFVVSLVFPSLNSALGSYTFVVFAVINAFGFFFTLLFVPETKGRSVEEILGTSAGVNFD
ncbi:Bifunctional purine biosynthesis protein PurH [Massospora cicadina]|nr:Bifunctional purine biosynthesis protein PurH [Massospora cicadina]